MTLASRDRHVRPENSYRIATHDAGIARPRLKRSSSRHVDVLASLERLFDFYAAHPILVVDHLRPSHRRWSTGVRAGVVVTSS